MPAAPLSTTARFSPISPSTTGAKSTQIGRARLTGWRLDLLWLLPAVLGHALGLALFINWADVFDNAPFHFTDYATHYAAVDAVSHFLAQGRLWGYSPYFYAGAAEGTLFDVDNKGVELASYWLQRAGLSLPHAYNAVMLGLMTVAPFAVYFAARLLGLPAATAGVSQLLTLAVWYGDGTVRWMWQGSILAFAAAALGSLIVAGAFWIWAERSSALDRPSHWHPASLLLWFGLGPILFWIHAETVAILAILLGVGAAIFGARWRWRQWLIALGWCLWIVLVNWPWLSTALRFWNTHTASDQLQGGLAQLRYDLGVPYAWLRLAILAMALLGLWAWRRAGSLWWRPIAAGLVVCLTLAYSGARLGLGALEPYRLILPALSLATIPAAAWLLSLAQRSSGQAALAVVLVAGAAAPALYAGRPQHQRQLDGTPSDYLSGPTMAEQAVCRQLSTFDLGAGRVLINDWRLGAWLPECSGAQVIGGPFYKVWTSFGYANVTGDSVFQIPVDQLTPAQMAALWSAYNVHWVVLNTTFHDWVTLADWDRRHPGLMQPLASQGPFEVLAVAQPATWFFQGAGQVSAGYNRLTIRGATPGGLLLKYHWLASLRTVPALPMRAAFVGSDPVPFIAVDNGSVADFDILQSYD